MSINAPTLDDRTFEDLFAQARALIPRYAPEWTDFNESDPGIALLQLQAFFADQLIYRLNQVPDRNYLKFLALLGITLQSASPAQVDVTFTTSSSTADAIVPAGTQLATAGGSDGSPVVFSLPQAMNVTAASLAAAPGVRLVRLPRRDDREQRSRPGVRRRSGRSPTPTARCCSGFSQPARSRSSR